MAVDQAVPATGDPEGPGRRARADQSAAEERLAVVMSPADINTKRRLQRKVDKAVERAHKMSFKGQWQVAAAADLYQRYGVNVAVGFLRAYGWQHSPDLYYQVTGKVMRGCC